jgi:hypothetical protein
MQQDYEDHDTFADEPDPYVQEMTTPAAHREPARFPTNPATRSRDMWNRAQRTPTRAPPSIQRSNDVRFSNSQMMSNDPLDQLYALLSKVIGFRCIT